MIYEATQANPSAPGAAAITEWLTANSGEYVEPTTTAGNQLVNGLLVPNAGEQAIAEFVNTVQSGGYQILSDDSKFNWASYGISDDNVIGTVDYLNSMSTSLPLDQSTAIFDSVRMNAPTTANIDSLYTDDELFNQTAFSRQINASSADEIVTITNTDGAQVNVPLSDFTNTPPPIGNDGAVPFSNVETEIGGPTSSAWNEVPQITTEVEAANGGAAGAGEAAAIGPELLDLGVYGAAAFSLAMITNLGYAVYQDQTGDYSGAARTLDNFWGSPSGSNYVPYGFYFTNNDLKALQLLGNPSQPSPFSNDSTLNVDPTIYSYSTNNGNTINLTSDGSGGTDIEITGTQIAPVGVNNELFDFTSALNLSKLIQNYSNGTSQITTYNQDGSSTTNYYSGPNGTGALTKVDQENANDTSEITTYNSSGSTTITYTGPHGTGVVIGGDLINSIGSVTTEPDIITYKYSGTAVSAVVEFSNIQGQVLSATLNGGGVTVNSGVDYQIGDVFAVIPATLQVEQWGIVGRVNGEEVSVVGYIANPTISAADNEFYENLNVSPIVYYENEYASGSWSLVSMTTAATVTPDMGQTQQLSDVLSNPSLTTAGNIQDVTVTGPGTVEVAGVASVLNVSVNTGGDLVLQGGSLQTDPITVAVDGRISGYGSISGSVENFGTITAQDGTLELGGPISGSGSLVFGSSGSFQLDGTTMPANTISGFVPGDMVDLADVTYDSAGNVTLPGADILQIEENGTNYDLDLDPSQNFEGDVFQLTADTGNGTDVLVLTPVESAIFQLYYQILDRTADATGLAGWVADLASGDTLQNLRVDIANSSEAQGDLTRLYQNILNRAPDAGGLAGWTNYLAGGGTLAQARADIANSGEAQNDLTQLYETILGRAPDTDGLAGWTNYLAGGGSLTEAGVDIANSPEAQGDLAQLYQNILNRAPDAGGLAGWTNYLAGGGTLAQARVDIANSGEAQSDLTQLYETILGRAPDTHGLAGWTSYLAGGAMLSTVQFDIAHSSEAQGDLTSIFQNIEGRAPDMAELAGMENQLVPFGTSLASVEANLGSNGPTGFTDLIISSGSQSLTALSSPEAFDFSNVTMGQDTIYGFDPTQDAIRISHTTAASFAQVQASFTASAAGTVMSFGVSQSIYLPGVAPTSLSAPNFRFL
ncbi:MAG: DUF4214 domain-containing protein [Alphaproteobacteria bacterium]|nr:DUF4214 domain-containing protein [Alphaproteobacteria bacterium]